MLRISAMLSLVILTACCQVPTTVSDATDAASFCQIAKPIRWSKLDTPETIEQVKELNAIGIKICGWH